MGYFNYSTGNSASTSTDALFRAYVASVIAAFVSCGWVQTTDTGQINTVTVLTPSGANQDRGYAVFQMDDALQGSAPIFVKVNFGSGQTAGYVGLAFVLGTGSNGSGTITGAKYSGLITANATAINKNSTASAGLLIAGDTDRIFVAFDPKSTWSSQTLWFSIERTKGVTGANSADGVLFAHGHRSSDNLALFAPVLMNEAAPTPENKHSRHIPANQTSIAGSNVGLWPVPMDNNGFKVNPGLNMLIYRNADITNDSTIPVDCYDGDTHDYLTVQTFAPSNGTPLLYPASVAGWSFAIRKDT